MAIDTRIIENFEGERLTSYPDPETGGAPWTEGFGATHHVDGSPVQPGETITHAEAVAELQAYVQRNILPAAQQLPGWSEMSADQQSALVDFAYNLGPGDLFPPHTLGIALAERRWADVPAALLLYDDPGTSCEAGLLRRREAEAALWRQGMQQPIHVALQGDSVDAHAYLAGGHVMVAVRAVADAVGWDLQALPDTVTVISPEGASHTLPTRLTIINGIGYVRAVDLAQAMGLPVSFDAPMHALRIG